MLVHVNVITRPEADIVKNFRDFFLSSGNSRSSDRDNILKFVVETFFTIHTGSP